MSMTSPIFKRSTLISRGSEPLSSIVLKKIGAILPPIVTPPVLLFGTYGISSPICHSREFVADFLEEPVPTTSPTYTSGNPFVLSSHS